MDEMVVAEASKSAIQYKRVMRTLRWLDALHPLIRLSEKPHMVVWSMPGL